MSSTFRKSLSKLWDWKQFLNKLDCLEHNILGLMSGTSADGLDIANVRFIFDGNFKYEVLNVVSVPYESEIRDAILQAYSSETGNVEHLTKLNFELARWHARVIKKLGWEFDIIAYHGQTVHHLPSHGATFQIGEPDILAVELGCPVIFGFRTKDVALGGQGAPISAYFDAYFFLKEPSTAVLNVGGISNVTVLTFTGQILAFDTGPGNCLIDMYVKEHFDLTFDLDGNLSRRGKVDSRLLDYLIESISTYITMPPPKTTGRELFSSKFLRKVEDVFRSVSKSDFLRTLVSFTACAVSQNLRLHAPHVKKLVVFGGGAHNLTLLEEITLCGYEIEVPDKNEVDFREAIAIAFLGELFIRGYAFEQTVTGAKIPGILGKLAIPR